MIELVSDDRCTRCDACIRVCPTNVFDHGPDRLPVIARQDDCQTCFMCEAWCPADALFVAPQITPVSADSPYRNEAELIKRGLLGSYRHNLGWGATPPFDPLHDSNQTLRTEPLPFEARRPQEVAQ